MVVGAEVVGNHSSLVQLIVFAVAFEAYRERLDPGAGLRHQSNQSARIQTPREKNPDWHVADQVRMDGASQKLPQFAGLFFPSGGSAIAVRAWSRVPIGLHRDSSVADQNPMAWAKLLNSAVDRQGSG